MRQRVEVVLAGYMVMAEVRGRILHSQLFEIRHFADGALMRAQRHARKISRLFPGAAVAISDFYARKK